MRDSWLWLENSDRPSIDLLSRRIGNRNFPVTVMSRALKIDQCKLIDSGILITKKKDEYLLVDQTESDYIFNITSITYQNGQFLWRTSKHNGFIYFWTHRKRYLYCQINKNLFYYYIDLVGHSFNLKTTHVLYLRNKRKFRNLVFQNLTSLNLQ